MWLMVNVVCDLLTKETALIVSIAEEFVAILVSSVFQR
jgi:hypothetical protein